MRLPPAASPRCRRSCGSSAGGRPFAALRRPCFQLRLAFLVSVVQLVRLRAVERELLPPGRPLIEISHRVRSPDPGQRQRVPVGERHRPVAGAFRRPARDRGRLRGAGAVWRGGGVSNGRIPWPKCEGASRPRACRRGDETLAPLPRFIARGKCRRERRGVDRAGAASVHAECRAQPPTMAPLIIVSASTGLPAASLAQSI